MARLLWPGDYEWMYLTNDLLMGRVLPASDVDGRATDDGPPDPGKIPETLPVDDLWMTRRPI